LIREKRRAIIVVGGHCTGKTTLVNALVGARLLPTDVEVLSAGMLCVSNGHRLSLQVEGDCCPARAMRSVDEIRCRVAATLHTHRLGRAIGCRPPEPRIFISAALDRLRADIGLASLGLVVFDSPPIHDSRGMLDEADRGEERPALPILVADYGQLAARETFEETLATVSRLRHVRGRLPLIVALNKVDLRTSEDQPLETIRDSLRDSCSRRLGCEVKVVPLSAALMWRLRQLASRIADEMVGAHGAGAGQRVAQSLAGFASKAPELGRFRGGLPDGMATLVDRVFLDGAGEASLVDVLDAIDAVLDVCGGSALLGEIRAGLAESAEACGHDARTRYVAGWLRRLIACDGRVLDDERCLAASLLCEFQERFVGAPSVDDFEGLLDEQGDDGEVIGRVEVPMGEVEHRWLVEALRKLAAVDREVHDREIEVIGEIEATLMVGGRFLAGARSGRG
jgi:signal recognition particle receptor subunit beta